MIGAFVPSMSHGSTHAGSLVEPCSATVCICAHNEAGVLVDAVKSVMAQRRISAAAYEVLVVDSASDDGTGDVLRDLSVTWGERLRWVREDVPGLSRARNRGLAEARGAVTAFIDADAVAEPDWLAGIVDVFREFPGAGAIPGAFPGAGAGAVGGPVRVKWEHAKPKWWRRELDEVFNAYSPGESAMKLTYPRYPYGTNLAVRTDAARALGGFATALGRQGRALLAGEDGELCLRLEKAGWHVLFAPGSVVHHRTREDRLSRRFILKRAFRHGRSQRTIERLHGFDSGLYPSWWRLLAMVCGRIVTIRCGLPFAKFAMFRLGYRWEGLKGRKVEASHGRNGETSQQINKSTSQQAGACSGSAPMPVAHGRGSYLR